MKVRELVLILFVSSWYMRCGVDDCYDWTRHQGPYDNYVDDSGCSLYWIDGWGATSFRSFHYDEMSSTLRCRESGCESVVHSVESPCKRTDLEEFALMACGWRCFP